MTRLPGMMALGVAVFFALALLGTVPGGSSLHLVTSAMAQEGPVIRQIDVRGNQRIEDDTVISYMTLKRGSTYTAAGADASIKSLFRTGLFADISMNMTGSTLIVSVAENPIINRVAFEGNSSIDSDTLNEEIQLKPRVVYTRAKVQSDVTRIVELYRRGGRFSATVEPKIIQLPQNRVDLVFEISEGPKTKVASINFIGNEKFSDSDLRDVISTSESAWWKFFSSSDSYDPDRLTYDRELLRRYYLQRGYADFRVVSAEAELSRDQSAFYITFTVEEGPVYKFGKISLTTELDKLNRDTLEKQILPKEGETYDAGLIDKTVDALTYQAGAAGYAFAEVRPRVKRHKDTKTIDISFQISEGPRVYVERINITGNSRTLDSVIRRQMEMSEGDAFNKVLLDKSEKNIRGLQYFSRVDVTQNPGSEPDRTIVNVDVQEQSTGSLSLSAGFSTLDNAVAGIQLAERNFLGKGLQISANLSLSLRRQLIDFHYTDPYFLGRNLVGGIDLFGSQTDFQTEASYDSMTQGGGLRFGFPLSEKSNLLLRYQLRLDRIYNVSSTSAIIQDAAGSELRSIIGYRYYYDDRNDPVDPTGGWDFQFDQNFAGLGGTVRYVKTEADARYYYKVAKGFVATQSLKGGYVHGLGQRVRLSDHFYLGGAEIRGFKRGGVGPRDLNTTNQDAIGAQAYVIGSTELTFPNGIPEALGIRTAIFADYGYIGLNDTRDPYGTTNIKDAFAPRVSTGISVNWQSPFGPVKLDFAKVLMSENYDQEQIFRFSAGTQF